MSVLSRFLLAVVCICSSVLLSARSGDVSYAVESVSIEGRGDSLKVTLRWSFSGLRVGKSGAMVFQAGLSDGIHSAQLRPVSLYGKKAGLSVDLVRASGREDEIPVTGMVASPERRIVVSETVIPYEPWMDSVRVSFSLYEWNRKKLQFRSSGSPGIYLKPSRPEFGGFPWEVTEPSAPEDGYRPVRISAPVRFRKGAGSLDLSYEDNGEQVEYLAGRLRMLTTRAGRFRLKAPKLFLFVSPEDAVAKGKLSSTRMSSLYSRLRKSGAFVTYGAQRVSGMADWEGVMEWIANGPHASDSTLLGIMLTAASDEERVSRLKAEKAGIWEEMSKDCFPSTGRAVFMAECRPPVFRNPDEVRPLLESIPEALTPWDFWYLSTGYARGSAEWLDVILAGAGLHPRSAELNLAAAFGLIEAGNAKLALPYLRNAGESAAGAYASAAWCYAEGRLEVCISVLGELKVRDEGYSAFVENALAYLNWELNRVSWRKENL